ARVAIDLRKKLILSCKYPIVCIYMEDNIFYVTDKDLDKYEHIIVGYSDLKFKDTIKDISEDLYKSVNGNK
ncbi:MAG: hypothetical protein ACRCXT_11150, partial [Paraclostridium sp.]